MWLKIINELGLIVFLKIKKRQDVNQAAFFMVFFLYKSNFIPCANGNCVP
jgi:hypothetical protein